MSSHKHNPDILGLNESKHQSANAHDKAAHAVQREFGDASTVKTIFDISKSHLYRLLEAGLIKSVSLKGRGKTRGRRLYNLGSIRTLLHQGMEEGFKPEREEP